MKHELRQNSIRNKTRMDEQPSVNVFVDNLSISDIISLFQLKFHRKI